MLRQLVEAWASVPQWLRLLIGVQVAVAGWLLHGVAAHAGASDGLAGFTIGLGLSIAMLSLRGRPAEPDGD